MSNMNTDMFAILFFLNSEILILILLRVYIHIYIYVHVCEYIVQS